MLHKTSDGFDKESALKTLIDKYGMEDSKQEATSPVNKRKSDGSDEDGSQIDSKKKAKKSEVVANEKNRPVAEAIKEMADACFKSKDMRKGGKYSHDIALQAL